LSTGCAIRAFVSHVRMSTRAQNEKKFGNWEELPGGGRRY
jgi:hypothetical protein